MKSILALSFAAALLAGGAAQAQAPAATPAPAAAPAPVDPAKFLADNAKAPGVVVLPSGMQYKVISSGPAGPSPKEGDVIKVEYEGALADGTVFDSTKGRRPMIMQLLDLVPGWMEALPKMHVGDEWMLYLPSDLGYGPRGAGPIPPNSVLVFKLKLLGMLSAD